MNIPANLLYTKTHEWVEMTGDDTARIGITDFAQNALGDLVFVNLPQVGDDAVAGEVFADVESVKAVSDIYSPVTGNVVAINESILDAPELINSDPYGSWFAEISDVIDKDELITAEEYEQICAQEE